MTRSCLLAGHLSVRGLVCERSRSVSPAVYSRSDSTESNTSLQVAPTKRALHKELTSAGERGVAKKAKAPSPSAAKSVPIPPPAPSSGGRVKSEPQSPQHTRPALKAKCVPPPRPSVKQELAPGPDGTVRPTPTPVRSDQALPSAAPPKAPVPTPPATTAVAKSSSPPCVRVETPSGVVTVPVPRQPPPTPGVSVVAAEAQETPAEARDAPVAPHRQEQPLPAVAGATPEANGSPEVVADAARVATPTATPGHGDVVDTPSARVTEMILDLDASARKMYDRQKAKRGEMSPYFLDQAFRGIVESWSKQDLDSMIAWIEQHPVYVEYILELQSEICDPEYKFGCYEKEEDVIHFYTWLEQTGALAEPVARTEQPISKAEPPPAKQAAVKPNAKASPKAPAQPAPEVRGSAEQPSSHTVAPAPAAPDAGGREAGQTSTRPSALRASSGPRATVVVSDASKACRFSL